MAEWQTMETAPKDRIVQFFCPGACEASKNILQGIWNDRLGIWTLNPYGTAQFTTLYPSRWAEIDDPPA